MATTLEVGEEAARIARLCMCGAMAQAAIHDAILQEASAERVACLEILRGVQSWAYNEALAEAIRRIEARNHE